MNFAGNTEIIRKLFHDHQKKIVCCCSFNHSFAQNILYLTKVIFIQGAFKNIQGLLWKIQGLFQDIPQICNFQGLFKARANHEGLD